MFGIRSRFTLGLFPAVLFFLTEMPAAATAPAPGTQIEAKVALNYNTLNHSAVQTVTSETAAFLVGQIAGVTLTPSVAAAEASTASDCVFPLSIHNTGTGRDQYQLTITVPTGWSAVLVRDDNGDGIHLTGETSLAASAISLDADGIFPVFLIVHPPPHTDGSVQTMVVRAASQSDLSVVAEARMKVSTTVSAAPINSLPVAWTVQTGAPVFGGAAVWNGLAFVGSDDGCLYAISAKGPNAGTVIWKFSTGARLRCTPAVYRAPNGQILVTTGNDAGMLITLDAATGQALWSRSVGIWRLLSWRSAPLVSGGGALVTVPDGQGRLCTYHTLSGSLVRRVLYQQRFVMGDPAVSGPDGRAWLAAPSGWASEVRFGLPLRSLRLPLPTLGGITLDPATNSLLAVSSDGHVFSLSTTTLRPNPHWGKTLGPAVPQPLASPELLDPDALLPIPTGTVALGAAVEASAALDPVGGTLYVGTGDHKVHALNTADGTRLGSGWPFTPSGPGRFLAKPLAWETVAGGASTLYLGDTAGVFYAVPVDHPDQPLSFTTVLDGTGNTLFGEWDAQPAASGTSADDVVIAGNTNGLIYGFTLR